MRRLIQVVLFIALAAVAYGIVALLLSGPALFFAPRDGAQPPMSSSSAVEVVAEGLEIPWAIAFLQGGDLLVTERPGRLVRIGEDRQVHEIAGVQHRGEGGLLGLALHPDFAQNHYLYLYFTTAVDGGTTNRVERYTYENDALSNRTEILTGIPGAANHDGGRIAFGPDGFLYITTGDAGRTALAQDMNSLAGKILRVKDDGSIPDDNPFGNEVYSIGHRNPQGIAWDREGRLWSTEHGPSFTESGNDELNFIEAGKNYGWPQVRGMAEAPGMESPVIESGSEATWAPASAAYANGSLFFGGLRGNALYEAVLDGAAVSELKTHFFGAYGRIREVVLGPDGYLYFTTSNRDGRGTPVMGDDKILRMKI